MKQKFEHKKGWFMRDMKHVKELEAQPTVLVKQTPDMGYFYQLDMSLCV